jgi:dephospho-CoA kinase
VIIVGLTGSIGMGKSTTAKMFAEAGVPVHDSDEAVHRLYAGAAAPLVEAAFPGTTVDGVVDRPKLSRAVLGNPSAMKTLERIVHPLVRADADAFVKDNQRKGSPLIVLDIPLLFETGGRARVDKVVVVTASPDVQRARVLARPGMTSEKFSAILANQVPDEEKRRLADFVIDTGKGIAAARQEVRRIADLLKSKAGQNAPR